MADMTDEGEAGSDLPRSASGSAPLPAGRDAAAPIEELGQRLEALAGLELEELRDEWRKLYRAAPPLRLSRDLLQRSIAHRMQEETLGGLSTAAQRQLAALARSLAADGKQPPVSPAVKLKPGTTLVREWHGRTHTVIVQEKGFEHEGRSYASLTQIAHLITGAHWSGPRFFGLRRTPKRIGQGAADGE